MSDTANQCKAIAKWCESENMSVKDVVTQALASSTTLIHVSKEELTNVLVYTISGAKMPPGDLVGVASFITLVFNYWTITLEPNCYHVVAKVLVLDVTMNGPRSPSELYKRTIVRLIKKGVNITDKNKPVVTKKIALIYKALKPRFSGVESELWSEQPFAASNEEKAIKSMVEMSVELVKDGQWYTDDIVDKIIVQAAREHRESFVARATADAIITGVFAAWRKRPAYAAVGHSMVMLTVEQTHRYPKMVLAAFLDHMAPLLAQNHVAMTDEVRANIAAIVLGVFGPRELSAQVRASSNRKAAAAFMLVKHTMESIHDRGMPAIRSYRMSHPTTIKMLKDIVDRDPAGTALLGRNVAQAMAVGVVKGIIASGAAPLRAAAAATSPPAVPVATGNGDDAEDEDDGVMVDAEDDGDEVLVSPAAVAATAGDGEMDEKEDDGVLVHVSPQPPPPSMPSPSQPSPPLISRAPAAAATGDAHAHANGNGNGNGAFEDGEVVEDDEQPGQVRRRDNDNDTDTKRVRDEPLAKATVRQASLALVWNTAEIVGGVMMMKPRPLPLATLIESVSYQYERAEEFKQDGRYSRLVPRWLVGGMSKLFKKGGADALGDKLEGLYDRQRKISQDVDIKINAETCRHISDVFTELLS